MVSVFLTDFSLIDDSPSKSENMNGFREHRHDQSVFSLLFKVHGCIPFESGDTIPYISKNPIWGCRDKGLQKIHFATRLQQYIKAHIKFKLFKLHQAFPRQTARLISILKKIQQKKLF